MSTPKSVLELAKKSGAKMVDIKFVDTFGTWQHFSMPISELTEESFAEGLGFDGSSIRGWKSIEASDMLAMPDPATAFIDPFMAVPTLSLTCTIAETGTREPYIRDPRGIAQRAEKYLASTSVADQAFFGPEAEFFIFDNVQYDHRPNGTFYSVDGEEGIWNTGKDEMPNLGYKIRHKEGYFPVGPADTQQDIRTEMVLLMEQLGVKIERQHHEVATAGQAEIDYRFDTLVRSADAMMVYRYVVKNVAKRHGKTATFMPKPLFGDNGSGMHTHQSLWKKGKPLFAGNEYAGLNKIDPGEPMDKNLYELPPEEMAKVPQILGSLEEAIKALEKDHAFLLKGDVFTEDFIEMWIAAKRKEHDALRLRPHPYEFFLYYDV